MDLRKGWENVQSLHKKKTKQNKTLTYLPYIKVCSQIALFFNYQTSSFMQ